jgi:hypothetical protein
MPNIPQREFKNLGIKSMSNIPKMDFENLRLKIMPNISKINFPNSKSYPLKNAYRVLAILDAAEKSRKMRIARLSTTTQVSTILSGVVVTCIVGIILVDIFYE